MRRILVSAVFLFLAAALAAEMNVWIQQGPPVGGNWLNELHVFDANNVIGFGNNGTIIKTTNGGAKWTQKTSGTSASFFDATFIDSQTGWAVGSGGTIIKTTDGGENWEPQTSGTSDAISAVHFIDANTGWAVGYDRLVLTTTDGGTIWTKAVDNASMNYWEDVHFFNATTGVAAGWSSSGNIFLTSDGGQSWSPIDVGIGWIKDLYFYNDLVGWAAGVTAPYMSVTIDIWGDLTINFPYGKNGAVWKTTDGGASWEKVTLATTNWIESVYFADSNTGWAVNGSGGKIFKTTDGGDSWTKQTMPVDAPSSLYDIEFADVNTGWAMGSGGVIFNTTNGGDTWLVQQSPGTPNWLNSVDFVDSKTGWAVGWSNTILKTTNSGSFWLSSSTGAVFYFMSINSVDFVDSNNGWIACNEGYICKIGTGDQSSGTRQNLNCVQFIDSNTGWIVGNSGTILKTIDGGKHWNPQTSGIANSLNSVRFLDAYTGWAVGYPGTILKTTDGGDHWNSQMSYDAALNSIDFVDSMTGWTVGSGGTILKTTDGGTTWNPQTSRTTNDLESVHFISSTTGWAVGSGGTILITTDGGENWIPQISGTTAGLEEVHFVDAGGGSWWGWAVGSGGTILYTSYAGGTIDMPVISGTVKTSGGDGIAGVTITFSNGEGSATTDSNGNYTKNVVSGWSGTATPVKTGRVFAPASRDYTNVTSDLTGQDYTAAGMTSYTATITAPNGGEWWGIGKLHNITWTSTGPLTHVKLEYSTNGGSSYTTIINSTLNDGTYTWIVPNTPSAKCLVRISEPESGISLDVSDHVFIIAPLRIINCDFVGTWDGQGVYYRNSDTKAWVKIASPATLIACGDLSFDGIDDLIGIWPKQGGVWMKNSVSDSWTLLSSTARHIAAGDMNGDGKVDLLGTWDGQGVFYRDSMTGNWGKLASPASLVAAGDLDDDGTDDLIGIWPGQGGVWVKYSKTGTWAKLSSTARDIAAGDMNGDGWDDFLGTWDGQGVYYRNSKTGAWVKMATPADQVTCGNLDASYYGPDDLIGVWPGQEGVWIKYGTWNTWAKLSTASATDIAAGIMRVGGSAASLGKISTSTLPPGIMFEEPESSLLGPENIGKFQDLSAEGPGGWKSAFWVDKDLDPNESDEMRFMRIPGPGEPGFTCVEQKNLFPEERTEVNHLKGKYMPRKKKPEGRY